MWAVRARGRFVLIAGGIGITPMVSLLRTAADAGDRRSFVLVYGSLRWEEVTFREQVERLKRRLNLGVVDVLTDPRPGWPGETGFIDDRLFAKHRLLAAEVFLCGPPRCSPPPSGPAAPRVPPHTEQFVAV